MKQEVGTSLLIFFSPKRDERWVGVCMVDRVLRNTHLSLQLLKDKVIGFLK